MTKLQNGALASKIQGLIAAPVSARLPRKDEIVNKPVKPTAARRIIWLNVLTVISAAILIGAEVFGAAFAGSWAVASLFNLGAIGAHILEVIFFSCGLLIMAAFIRAAQRVEPFTAPE
jgi:hypothetical protein